MQLLDLFSGIGGFSLAARWAGIETIQFVEKDGFCQKVLMKNFPNVPIHDDIKTFNFYKDVDVLTGGFPCQPFSVAGKKKGLSDERYLWPDMLRVIRQCRPRFIIAENVPGIIPLLDTILEDLEKEGYDWRAYIIPASDIGAPHKRERLWVIANRNSERCESGANLGEKRPLQSDGQWHIEAIQSEWSQLIPQSWATFSAQEWLTSIANPTGERCEGKGSPRQPLCPTQDRKGEANHVIDDSIDTFFGWQKDQPPISGMDDGIPNGVDRCKSLGNAIVPQIAYIFLKSIRSMWNTT